jgi:hypothetical protein
MPVAPKVIPGPASDGGWGARPRAQRHSLASGTSQEAGHGPIGSPRRRRRMVHLGWPSSASLLLALSLADCSAPFSDHAGRPPHSATVPAPRTSVTATTTTPLPTPAPITPIAEPALPGEGRWLPAGDHIPGGSAIYMTQLRAAAVDPPAGVAWIDAAATTMSLYAGTAEPHGSWTHQAQVAPAQQSTLLAAFNSGFHVYDYPNGWYADGRAAVPLAPGKASLVIFADGTATVADWGRDVQLGPSVVAVRQNLALLVDAGSPTPAVSSPWLWGDPLHERILTWRSGIGVTLAGDLVYVGGPMLDPASLARLFVAAGAVRAMELDINPEWVSFVIYHHPGIPGIVPPIGTDLIPSMYFPPNHYLAPASRDFFTVSAR